MNYAYFPTPNIYVNTGFSVHHINRPHESFFESDAVGVDNRVPMRYIGFLNGSFKLNDEVILNPNIYYTRQANASELVGGLNAHYNLSGDGEYLLIAGAYYRHKEAIIPMIGLGYKDYTFSFTYDATISSLKNYNASRGAFEFSLIKQGVISPGSQKVTPCPTLFIVTCLLLKKLLLPLSI
jgi:type IX secretion system PorP/SprF family membrane protein